MPNPHLRWAIGATVLAIAVSSAGPATASPTKPTRGDLIDYVVCTDHKGVRALSFTDSDGTLVANRRLALRPQGKTSLCGNVLVTVSRPISPYLTVTGYGAVVTCGIWVNNTQTVLKTSTPKAICGKR